MNRNKLHGLRQRTAADSLIGELLDALLDEKPAAEAAELEDGQPICRHCGKRYGLHFAGDCCYVDGPERFE